jgi:HlyD family secretion protein
MPVDVKSPNEELTEDIAGLPPLAPFPDLRVRKRRRLAWTLAFLLGIGLIAGVLIRSELQSLPPVQYQVVKANRGPIIAKVTATGTLSALVTVQVGSQVSGRIQKIYADFHSHVKRGQVVAEIDPALFRAAWLQAQADLANAKANAVAARAGLEKAKATEVQAGADYERNAALAQEGIISPQQLDQARANAETASADVLSAQATVIQAAAQVKLKEAALNSARISLDETLIRAPIDGTAISRNVDVGQTVAAAFQAPVLFTIAKDLRRMQVDTNVGEADVGRLRKGMQATFTVDAYQQEWFVGTVRQIRNAAQTVQNVVTYDAVIDVNNLSLRLRPGMTANVEFIVAQRANVIRIPNAVLLFQPNAKLLRRMHVSLPTAATQDQPSRKVIWILRDDTPIPVFVSLGISDGSMTELVRGDVRPGDALITDMTARAKGGLL